MPRELREVWACYDNAAGGRLVGLHASMKNAVNAEGPMVDDMEFVKLPLLTPESAAVLSAAEAFITSERGDNTVELYLALASATNAYRAAKGAL